MPRKWVEFAGGTWTDIDLVANHETLAVNSDEDRLRRLALSGDLVFVAVPAEAGSSAAAVTAAIDAATDDTYRKTVAFELRNAAGEVHTWWTGTRTIGIADDADGAAAIAGTASATTVVFVAGVATVTIEYTGVWAAEKVVTLTLTAGDVAGHTLSNKTHVDTLVA